MKNIAVIILVTLLFTSCFKEADLLPTEQNEDYVLEPNGDAADSYIYNFYQTYGSKLIYEVELNDFRSDLKTNFSVAKDTFILIQNRELLIDGLNFLETEWLSKYDDDFKAKYLPFWIFIMDQIIDYENTSSNSFEIADVTITEKYMAIGNLGESLETVDVPAFILNLDLALFRDHLVAKDLLEVLDDFYTTNQDKYGASVRGFEAYAVSNDEKDELLKNEGFLFWHNKTNRSIFPSRKEDLQHYIELLLTIPKEGVEELLIYPSQRLKYNILLKYFEEELNIVIN